MKTDNEIIGIGQKVISKEAMAVQKLSERLGKDFADCVRLILDTHGRLVITGIGKSAIIGNKVVSTLNSTGTPAIFMHAADAIHGDLGIIQNEDIVLCISNSGNTPEIKVLVPLLRMRSNRLIAMVGDTSSYLAMQADHVLNTHVDKEACPNNLAPTSSTTAQMAMGDALAVALLECRGFTQSEFASLHPGGALGKKLYLRVSDLFPQNEVPMVTPDTPLREVIIEISEKRLGAAAVINNGKLEGIITDGDIRRMLQERESIADISAKDIMSANCKTINKEDRAVDALSLMRKHNITQLPVMDGSTYVGVVHLHDILKEGII